MKRPLDLIFKPDHVNSMADTHNPPNPLAETKKTLDSVSPTVCGAKWLQTTIHLFNGHTQSCHHVQPQQVPLKEIEQGVHHLHNSNAKAEARRNMLKGEKIKECSYCWRVEKNGSISDRFIKSSEDWSAPHLNGNFFKTTVDTVIPTYLEVAFDNICNLKCMYCSPVYSSSWDAEIKKYGPYPTSRRFNSILQLKFGGSYPLPKREAQIYKNAFWQWWPELKNRLQHLRVTGGEPLLSADTWRLFEELRTGGDKNLIFSLNSNMMIAPKIFERFCDQLKDIQKKVSKVTLFCSIDSTGAQAEYLRHGLDEKLFYANLESLLTSFEKSLHVSFMITVNALSVVGLPNLLRRIYLLRRQFPNHQITFDTPYLTNPGHLSVLVLPKKYIKYLNNAKDVLTQNNACFTEIEKIERIIKHWEADRLKGFKKVVLRRDLLKMLKEHDRRRGTDFKKTFPEYLSFLRTIVFA